MAPRATLFVLLLLATGGTFVEGCQTSQDCQNGGTCSLGDDDTNSCVCTDRWSGPNCAQEIQTDNPILSGDSEEGDSSVTTESAQQSGDAVCTSLRCFNGGTCQELGLLGYVCVCPEEYQGMNCETDVDECEPGATPCENEGVCANYEGGFWCNCTSTGYTGETCSTPEPGTCLATPCENGGVCQRGRPGEYECSCSSGWTGERCEADVDECVLDPCRNGGSCQNIDGSYTCTCAPGWGGDQCGITEAISTQNDECAISEGVDEDLTIRTRAVLANCTKGSDRAFSVYRAFSEFAAGRTDVTLDSLIIGPSTSDFHTLFDLSGPPSEARAFNNLQQLVIHNVMIAGKQPGQIYLTANYPYKQIRLLNVTFTPYSDDLLVDLIGNARSSNEPSTAQELIQLKHLAQVTEVDTFLRSLTNMPVHLAINNLPITTIEARSFNWTDTPATEVIDLSNNQLEDFDFVPQIFLLLRDSPAFKKLILKGNRVREIGPELIQPYPQYLEMLDFSQNRIQIVDPCAANWQSLTNDQVGSNPRYINLADNPLVCQEECTNNFWMYRALYETSGKQRWSVFPETNFTCQDNETLVSEFFKNIPRCTVNINCLQKDLDFGKGAGGLGTWNALQQLPVLLTLVVVGLGLMGTCMGLTLGSTKCGTRKTVVKKRRRRRRKSRGKYGDKEAATKMCDKEKPTDQNDNTEVPTVDVEAADGTTKTAEVAPNKSSALMSHIQSGVNVMMGNLGGSMMTVPIPMAMAAGSQVTGTILTVPTLTGSPTGNPAGSFHTAISRVSESGVADVKDKDKDKDTNKDKDKGEDKDKPLTQEVSTDAKKAKEESGSPPSESAVSSEKEAGQTEKSTETADSAMPVGAEQSRSKGTLPPTDSEGASSPVIQQDADGRQSAAGAASS